jgi:hypothetical protein
LSGIFTAGGGRKMKNQPRLQNEMIDGFDIEAEGIHRIFHRIITPTRIRKKAMI